MFGTLLESRARIRCSPAGAIVSVCAHTLLIGGAVYATAQAHIAPAIRNDPVRPVYFVRSDTKPATPPHSVPGAPNAPASPQHPKLQFFDIPIIDGKAPGLQMSDATTRPDDFGTNRITVDASNTSIGARIAGTAAAFQAEEVDRQVALKPGNPPPLYPAALRTAGIEGKVIARFVVSEAGQAEDSTVRFVSSDNSLFADAVRTALGRMRFVPAEVGGKRVRQLVEMPFLFTLQK